MSFLQKLIFVLLFLWANCTIYYDDENTDEVLMEEGENEDDDGVMMLIQGGYHIEDPLYEKYVVSIRTRMQSEFFGDNHFCAGTMIATRMVLTAAHCLIDAQRIKTRPRRITVVAGTPNRLHHTANTLELQVERIIVHPLFKRNVAHDIAILYLKQEISLGNKAVRIISLATEHALPNTTCLTAGWGELFKNGPYATKIVYAIFNIEPNETCERAYGKNFNRDLHLCASSLKKNETDVCRGDIGGPLVCSNRLAGIVTWNVECANESKPTFFTDVFSHDDWLLEVSNEAHRIMFCFVFYAISVFVFTSLF